MSEQGSKSEILVALADEFVARLRRGERPSIQQYVERHPDLADEIRELFPAMAMMENIAPEDTSEAHPPPPDSSQAPLKLQRLGDYRILREVGRGGMGIVYEAEQISLGRHVALKVLPRQLLIDVQQKRRFEREAKAAARLHHTNIVPVFGVGEEDGLSYYVMQFIQGLGLDLVLEELKRLRSGGTPLAEPLPAGPPAGELHVLRRESRALSAAQMARSLVTGRYDQTFVWEDSSSQIEPMSTDATVTWSSAVAENSTAGTATGSGFSTGGTGGTQPSATAVQPISREDVSETPEITEPHAASTSKIPPITEPVRPALTAVDRLADAETATSPSPFVVMPGRSEASQTRSRKETYWQSVARIGMQVGEALEYAHNQGVLHRDVKPSNLLLDIQGTVWVSDFGLAKADDQQDLTHTGDIIGTLRYMPPEAFAGRTDARSDVYSLGLTLYELLSLKPAYDETERHRLIRQLMHDEPPRLSRSSRDVPRDLETIVHKAIEKSPERRYQTAGDLAADLERFLHDEPIQARRISVVERAARWARRHRGVAALLSVIALLLVAGSAASTVAALHFERVAAQREEARRDAVDARQIVETTLVDMSTERGLLATERGRLAQSVLWFATAAQISEHDPPRREANVARAAAHLPGTIRPVRILNQPTEWIDEMTFDPTGRFLLTRTEARPDQPSSCFVWDVDRGEMVELPVSNSLTAAAWNADGSLLAVGTDCGQVLLLKFPAATEVAHLPMDADHRSSVADLAFSPSGELLAFAAGNSARVWNVHQEQFATDPLIHPASVLSIALHPDGSRLVTQCADGRPRMFTIGADARESLVELVAEDEAYVRHRPYYGRLPRPRCLIVPDGRGVVFLTRSSVRHLDLETGRHIDVPFPNEFFDFVVSPCSRYVFIYGYAGQGRLFRLDTGEAVGGVYSHRRLQWISNAAFFPDSRTLLTASGDRQVKFWSLPEGTKRDETLEHASSASSVCISPEGRRVATNEQGGLIAVWDLPLDPSLQQPVPIGTSSFATVSPDGRYLAPTGRSQRGNHLSMTRAFEITSGQPAGPECVPDGLVLDARFSPDGRRLATAAANADTDAARRQQLTRISGSLTVFDWQTGARQWQVNAAHEIRSLDYRPDGGALAALCADGMVLVVDAESGRELRRWQAHEPYWQNNWYINNGMLQYSPDGLRIITWGTDAFARVWDADTGQLVHAIEHNGKTDSIAFSPDGRLLATSSWDRNEVRITELATGRPAADPLIHPDWAFSVDFSPDGRWLLTGCRDSMARVWDWQSGQLALPPLEHEHEVHVARFTPDGSRIVTASDDQTARLWDAVTGKAVTPPIPLSGMGLSVDVTSTGSHAVVGGFGTSLHVIPLDVHEPWGERDPDELVVYAEMVSGRRVQSGGDVQLTRGERLQRYQQARQQLPEMFGIEWSNESLISSYQSNAQAARAAGDWFVYFWNMDRLVALEPQNVEWLQRRGEQHGMLGQWPEAAADLRRIVELNPADHFTAYKLAHVLAELGDFEAYRDLCRRLLEQGASMQDPVRAERTAKACLLLAGAVDHPEQVTALAEFAATRGQQHPFAHWFFLCRGLAAYRDGEYDAAARWSRRARESVPQGPAVPWSADIPAQLIEAMADFQAGRTESAQTALAAARHHFAEQVLENWQDGRLPSYWDVLLCKLLEREAAALIEQGTPDVSEPID